MFTGNMMIHQIKVGGTRFLDTSIWPFWGIKCILTAFCKSPTSYGADQLTSESFVLSCLMCLVIEMMTRSTWLVDVSGYIIYYLYIHRISMFVVDILYYILLQNLHITYIYIYIWLYVYIYIIHIFTIFIFNPKESNICLFAIYIIHTHIARATSIKSTSMSQNVSPIGAEFRPTSKMGVPQTARLPRDAVQNAWEMPSRWDRT